MRRTRLFLIATSGSVVEELPAINVVQTISTLVVRHNFWSIKFLLKEAKKEKSRSS